MEITVTLFRNENSIKEEYKTEKAILFMKILSILQEDGSAIKHDLSKVDYYEIRITGSNEESEDE